MSKARKMKALIRALVIEMERTRWNEICKIKLTEAE
jgi:hypothetical protein